MKTFKSKLDNFSVLQYLPEIRSAIESSPSDVHANLMVLATYTYIDLWLVCTCSESCSEACSCSSLSKFDEEKLKKVSKDILVSFDHRDIDNQAQKQIEWASKNLTDTAPNDCDLKVGDVVTFTNEFGVSFENKLIIGFDHKEAKRPVHTASEAYWFGSHPNSLTKVA